MMRILHHLNNRRFTVMSLAEMVEERAELNSWRFNVLTKSKKQEFEQVVHISWERGSIYFDTVKIYLRGADNKGEPCPAGHALSQVVKHV